MPNQLQPVYPSTLSTVAPSPDGQSYGILLCKGYNNGEIQYSHDEVWLIPFVHRIPGTDSCSPGLQSEQLIVMLIDRLQKLNTVLPDPCNVIAMEKLKDALSALEERVRNREAQGLSGHKL